MKTEPALPRGGLYMKQIGGVFTVQTIFPKTTIYDDVAARKYPIEKTESYSVSTPRRDLRLPLWGLSPQWKGSPSPFQLGNEMMPTWRDYTPRPSVEYGTRVPGQVYTDQPPYMKLGNETELSARRDYRGFWLDYTELMADSELKQRVNAWLVNSDWRPPDLTLPMAIAREVIPWPE